MSKYQINPSPQIFSVSKKIMKQDSAARCPILCDDGRLIAVNKPAGMLSHPNPGGRRQAAAFAGEYDLGQRAFSTPARKIFLLHRLDLETSGVLLAARDRDMADRMRDLFSLKKIRKFYIALLQGAPPEGKKGRWLDYLEKSSGRRRAAVSVVKGRRPNAELLFRVTRIFPVQRLTMVEIELITGFTHQIRVQAASRHRPVLGDPLYGSFKANREMKRCFGLERMFLHASRVKFRHPVTGRETVIKAPLPEELNLVLNQLK